MMPVSRMHNVSVFWWREQMKSIRYQSPWGALLLVWCLIPLFGTTPNPTKTWASTAASGPPYSIRTSRRPRPATAAYDDADESCLASNFHLSPASNVDVDTSTINMTLSFTVSIDCPDSTSTPTISYGVVHPPRNHNSHNVTTTILPSESVQFSFSNYRRRYQSSQIYHAILSDIQAGSILYWYQADMVPTQQQQLRPNHPPPQPIRSRVIQFVSPPLPLEPVRLALIADWGGSKEAVKTMQGMLSVMGTSSTSTAHDDADITATTTPRPHLSAVIVAGDISYANADLPHWEDFLKTMEPLFSTVPLLVAPGNHEIECNRDDFQVFQAYEHYFRVPNRIHPVQRLPIPHQLSDCTHPAEFETVYNYGNSFYSYRHGMLQVIVLNSYTNTTKGSQQYEWFLEELATRVDRNWTPWLMVIFHCPLHTTFRGHNDERNPNLMMQDMEPLFVQYQVNLVLSGHNHAYVRSYPMIGMHRSETDSAPVYFTIGTGGDSHSQGPIHPDQPEPWVAHRDHTEYGFGELTIVNTTHAYFQRILNRGTDAHPDAQDDVWIRNYAVAVPADNTSDPFTPEIGALLSSHVSSG